MITAQIVSLMFHSFACSGSRFCINSVRILSKSAPRFQAQALSSSAPLLVPLRTFLIYLPAHGRDLSQGKLFSNHKEAFAARGLNELVAEEAAAHSDIEITELRVRVLQTSCR